MGQLQRKKVAVPSPQWIVLGYGSLISTSTNGNVWTNANTLDGFAQGGAYNYGIAAAYNGIDKWVAIGSTETRIIVSINQTATQWQGATAPYGGITGARGVAYGNGRWVVVGEGTFVATSTNGTSWNAVSSGSLGGLYNIVYKVAYGNGLWVATSSASLIAYSTNGTSWTDATSYGNLTHARGVAYGNGLWVVVGSRIATSTNGSNWYAAPSIGTFGFGISVAYGNGMWIAVGSGGIGYSIISKSTNGTNWVDATDIGGLNSASDVVYGNGKWIVCGSNPNKGAAVVTSTDGMNWSDSGNTGLGSFAFGIAFKS